MGLFSSTMISVRDEQDSNTESLNSVTDAGSLTVLSLSHPLNTDEPNAMGAELSAKVRVTRYLQFWNAPLPIFAVVAWISKLSILLQP